MPLHTGGGIAPIPNRGPVRKGKFAYLLPVLHRSTIQLLRFHFSLFLLPVYLFALSQLPRVNWQQALPVFLILHLLVYPSSNGYNSYMDRDDSPIGGLARPLQPTRQLFYASVVMDVAATALAFLVSPVFALGILFYILASRAYSYRRIRLKRLPLAGFLTVALVQGALVFFITYHGAHPAQTLAVPGLPCITASLLIGASYPLTQIYQHKQDKKDGVITISYLLGKRGTFLFSLCLFAAATTCLYAVYMNNERLNYFFLFLLYMLPVVLFFTGWMYKVWNNEGAADFKHSLRMNVVSTLCMTAYFSTLILIGYFE